MNDCDDCGNEECAYVNTEDGSVIHEVACLRSNMSAWKAKTFAFPEMVYARKVTCKCGKSLGWALVSVGEECDECRERRQKG